jgi:14-3-3 protein epsilon
MLDTREQALYLSKVAEQSERYDEMMEYMKLVVMSGQELTADERNMLSIAFKNAVGCRRASCWTISAVEKHAAKMGNDAEAGLAKEYRGRMEAETRKTCQDLLDLIATHVLPQSSSSEAKVFYLKMRGDYSRYVAEVLSGDEKALASMTAHAAYSQAMEIARLTLVSNNPTRLSLALNLSVFQYEVLKNKDEACCMGRIAYEEGMAVTTSGSEEAAVLLQLLDENLTLWMSDPCSDED